MGDNHLDKFQKRRLRVRSKALKEIRESTIKDYFEPLREHKGCKITIEEWREKLSDGTEWDLIGVVCTGCDHVFFSESAPVVPPTEEAKAEEK